MGGIQFLFGLFLISPTSGQRRLAGVPYAPLGLLRMARANVNAGEERLRIISSLYAP